jgi:hypothetical protein
MPVGAYRCDAGTGGRRPCDAGRPDRSGVLELGADDYLLKLFVFAELVARVRALSRRAPFDATGLARGTTELTAPTTAPDDARAPCRSPARSSGPWRPSSRPMARWSALRT